ncbi:MAG: TonB-dependent receptor [Cyclobacteriaceae bacterium]
MKFIFSFLIASLVFGLVAVQGQTKVSGAVKDIQGNPIEFATIRILENETERLITGGITSVDGKFEIDVPQANCFLEIGFIGYVAKRVENIDFQKGQVMLGELVLEEDSKQLDEVVISAQKSQTEFKLDKRVFNVGADITSTGMSALDVLNNVPSVNVNIEGAISLRGSTGVQILINGKPSVLASDEGNALGTITADMIERIEVITNPSAKYDAEGTSGIINIVIKKEERKGTNGSISLNTGVPHNHSLGFSLNRRTEHFNLFTQLGAGFRELPNQRVSINTNKLTGETIRSVGTEYRNENFYNFILGADYHINDFNVLTISGNYAYEIEDQPSSFLFSALDNGVLVDQWRRTEVTEANNPKYQYELNYVKEFQDDPENHTLLFSALGNFFGKDLSSDFTDETIQSDQDLDRSQRTETSFQEGKYTFKLDYQEPINDQWSIEAGGQYLINDVSNDFEVSTLEAGEWVSDPGFTNVFNYDLNVLGLYTTGAYEGEKWGFKGGLRMENAILETLLENNNEKNTQKFNNFFPSAHASYKIRNNVSLQAGYSRRVYRPRLWDLNPFFNVRNNFSIRTGNPNLLPEFTDSFELASVADFTNSSISMTVYQRNTTDVMERVAVVEDNVSITMPFNIGTNKATGLEINGKYDPLDWLSMDGDFNYSFFDRKGQFESRSFDFSAQLWTLKARSKFKLPGKTDVEVTGRYESAFRTFQSEISEVLFMDMGIRRKILKGRGVISGSVRDLFASRKQINEANQSDFYLYNSRLRGRFITLGFSYGFGKGEAMEYSGRRR